MHWMQVVSLTKAALTLSTHPPAVYYNVAHLMIMTSKSRTIKICIKTKNQQQQ